VDDAKISHAQPAVVKEIIKLLENEYGDLKASRGNKHTLLGMNIALEDDGTVTIETKDYLKEIINSFLDDATKKVTSPATKDIFEIRETDELFSNERSDIFHSTCAKLL